LRKVGKRRNLLWDGRSGTDKVILLRKRMYEKGRSHLKKKERRKGGRKIRCSVPKVGLISGWNAKVLGVVYIKTEITEKKRGFR